MQKIDYLKAELKKQVNKNRYLHSLAVAETAIKLAKIYDVDFNKAQIAGILHDFTKDWHKDKLERIIIENDELSKDILKYGENLWHGPVASVIIQEKLNITDVEVIQAVRFHTSGRKNMTKLEKVVCLADYIEPNRNFKGVNNLRKIAETDLNQALLLAFDGTIQSLIEKKVKIYPLTVEARNYLIEEIEGK